MLLHLPALMRQQPLLPYYDIIGCGDIMSNYVADNRFLGYKSERQLVKPNLMALRLQVFIHSPQEVQSGSAKFFPSNNGLIVGQGLLITQTPQSLQRFRSMRTRPGAIFSSSQLIAPIGQIE
jgi:hypothetical protein